MRREKQIEQFAQTQVDCEFFDESLYNGIIIGAQWADKNPKRYTQEELCGIQLEMMQQRDKRLIEKATEWLKNTIDEDVLVKCGNVIKCIDANDFSEIFRKAMLEK